MLVLTRDPLGYSRTLPVDGGGGVSAPHPVICQTNEPILDPKSAFDIPGLEPYEYVVNFYLNVSDDVICRVKGHFFLIAVIARFAGQNSCIKLK